MTKIAPAITMYHFILMRRADSGTMGDGSSCGLAGQFSGSMRRRNAKRLNTGARSDTRQFGGEHGFNLRRLGEYAAGFGDEKWFVLQTKIGDDACGEQGEGFSGGREDFLRDNVAAKRGLGYERKERRENAVGMLGDASEDNLPI